VTEILERTTYSREIPVNAKIAVAVVWPKIDRSVSREKYYDERYVTGRSKKIGIPARVDSVRRDAATQIRKRYAGYVA